MKHLKMFNFNNTPEVGDYVLCDIPAGDHNEHSELKEFMKNNIGIISSKVNNDFDFSIIYNHLPDSLSHYNEKNKKELGIKVYRDEIKHYSIDISKLETILSTNKFNI